MLQMLRFSAVMVLVSFFIGCAFAPKKREPLPASASARSQLEKAQIEIAANDERRALNRLKKLVAEHPGTDIADDALIMMGRVHFKNRDYSSAYQAFIDVVNADVFSPNEGEAALWAARSLQRLGRLDEALSLVNKGIKVPGLSNTLRLDMVKTRFELQTQLGDRLDALRSVVVIAEQDPDPSVRESFRVRAMDFVESRLSDEELETVAGSREFSLVRGYAQFRVGVKAFEQRDFDRARDQLSRASDSLAGTEVAERARSMIEQIDSRRRVDSRTVGVVLPLTGKQSAIAQRTLRGLQLGLGVYGADRSDLRLAVMDDGANADAARRAVERLVTEDHVIAVVGSLLSRTAVAVASKADELGVPSVALSQKSGITDLGSTVFRNALTSEMQVRQLVRVAMNDLGHKRFAILYPNDAYGVEFANLFWDEVLARGGQVSGAQSYTPSETDFSGPVRRLVGQYYVEERADEYKSRVSEWFKKKKSVGAREKPPEDLLPPIVEFDALFIPDAPRTVQQIVPTLAYYNISGPRLLGTNLWNSQELAKSQTAALNGAVFVDSYTSDDKDFTDSRFFKEFRKVFGENPGPFEAQGYDVGLMLRQALAGGAKTRPDLARALAQMSDFPGSAGRLTMTTPREFARPMVVLTIKDGALGRFSSVR